MILNLIENRVNFDLGPYKMCLLDIFRFSPPPPLFHNGPDKIPIVTKSHKVHKLSFCQVILRFFLNLRSNNRISPTLTLLLDYLTIK
jgi:hypothetical protein